MLVSRANARSSVNNRNFQAEVRRIAGTGKEENMSTSHLPKAGEYPPHIKPEHLAAPRRLLSRDDREVILGKICDGRLAKKGYDVIAAELRAQGYKFSSGKEIDQLSVERLSFAWKIGTKVAAVRAQRIADEKAAKKRVYETRVEEWKRARLMCEAAARAKVEARVVRGKAADERRLIRKERRAEKELMPQIPVVVPAIVSRPANRIPDTFVAILTDPVLDDARKIKLLMTYVG